jgi:aryl-alcohol dehydrogenase-like predicted oxidoreductase
MKTNPLGTTGIQVSALGFGCGAVGGLLTRGDDASMLRAVARAVEAGITYFDTAQAYGNGASETNLGRVLAQLKPDVTVGSKVMLRDRDFDDVESAIVRAVDVSLQRLQLQQLALFQLHNPIGLTRYRGRDWIGLNDLPAVNGAFEALRAAGKIAHWGINGLGDTDALHQALGSSGAETIQACFNLLNPSAGRGRAIDASFQDYRGLIPAAARAGIGVIAIRVLAGGALAGKTGRHPVAAQTVDPIATSPDYDDDVALAQRFQTLVTSGAALSLAEAAIRYAVHEPGISTALIGLSSLEQLEQAIAAAERGPLPANTSAAA